MNWAYIMRAVRTSRKGAGNGRKKTKDKKRQIKKAQKR